jgi:type II secretory pathway component GspD/PulD (secretin)
VHDFPTKFLRLLNCRTTLALVGTLAVLSFGGAGCAQIGANTGVAATKAVAGKPDGIQVINFTRLDDIPATTKVVTCVMPCRTAAASDYVKVLSKLGLKLDLAGVEPNSLKITGTGLDVRCAATAMLALDETGDGDRRSIEIFPMKYADANTMAAMVNELFAADRPQAAQPPRHSPSLMGPNPLMTPEGFAFGLNAQIFAKGDEHSNSLVVTAMEDMIPIIRDLVMKLDQPIEDVTEVRLFKLKHADCTEMAKMLANLFPKPGGAQTEYMRKLGDVLAVPDPRTQSLLVSASKDQMPQIEDIITALDEEPTGSHAWPATVPPGGVQTDAPASPGGPRGATGF